MNPARFRWGILFILAGGLLLAENFGEIPFRHWREILSLWPVLLIAIGVEKIFSKGRLVFVSYATSVVIAALVIYVAVAGSPFSSQSSRGLERYTIETDSSVRQLQVRIYNGNADLTVKDGAVHLFHASSRNSSRPPSYDYEITEDTGFVRMKAESGFGFLSIKSRLDPVNRVYINPNVPVMLYCQGEDGDMDIDATDLFIEKIEADNRDGNTSIKLSNKTRSIELDLSGEDNDVRLEIPSIAGVRVTNAEPELSQYLHKRGFIKNLGYLETDDYDSAMIQISISVRDNIERIRINRRPGDDSI